MSSTRRKESVDSDVSGNDGVSAALSIAANPNDADEMRRVAVAATSSGGNWFCEWKNIICLAVVLGKRRTWRNAVANTNAINIFIETGREGRGKAGDTSDSDKANDNLA